MGCVGVGVGWGWVGWGGGGAGRQVVVAKRAGSMLGCALLPARLPACCRLRA